MAIALLPNAGLGNKLLVWARCIAFARLNGLSPYVLRWNYPKIGPVIRRERRNIFYGKQVNTPALSGRIYALLRSFRMDRQYEPAIQRLDLAQGTAYVFANVPHWSDFFGSIHHMRPCVVQAFGHLISSSVLCAMDKTLPPLIAVHVRRGDFRELVANEKFAELGNVRTPLEYFTTIITSMRACAGWLAPITVFSDGTDAELRPLLALENVHRAPVMADIGHLALMAQAKVIIASAGSTFSMWAGFLSEAALILHPDHIHAPIRPVDPHDGVYEGPAVGNWTNWNETLIERVRSLTLG